MKQLISSLRVRAIVLASILALPPTALAQYSYKVLHAFSGGKDGGSPASSLVLDHVGNPYGTTYAGGTETGCPYPYNGGCGVIFELLQKAHGRWEERVLLDYAKGTGGATELQPLLFDNAGDLFGATDALEAGSASYIFQLKPAQGQWSFNPIYDAGGYCLVFDQASNLYGCIGPGGIGELSPGPDGWNYTNLCNSCSSEAPLSWDTHGSLYGTMLMGGNGPPYCNGSAGCGEAFRVTPNGDGTWTCKVLYRFAAFKTDGYYPYAGLTVDASGTAYGLTAYGGKYGNGTFFKLTPTLSGPWAETILYQFPNCANGCVPAFTLVSDKAGNLYGSAAGGLDCNGISCGVIFKLSPQKDGAWKYSVLHKFTGNDGAYPYGVVLDDKGNLFGTTNAGGKYNYGTVFELTP
jgi:uncharacterized repeat protein (TIGR03803 family)